MATASERGIPIKDETTYWWVWSAHGETDNGLFYNRVFVKGMIPLPLPGDIARDLEYRGYYLTEYVEGVWFSHWKKDENHAFHQHPIFKPLTELIKPAVIEVVEPASNGDGFPSIPQVMVPKLPPDWVDFLSHYTVGGKRKKEFRTDNGS